MNLLRLYDVFELLRNIPYSQVRTAALITGVLIILMIVVAIVHSRGHFVERIFCFQNEFGFFLAKKAANRR